MRLAAARASAAGLLILFSAVLACAQSSPPPASPAGDDCAALLKPCEQAVDELKVLRVEVAGLREQLKLRAEMDALREQQIADLKEQRDFWKVAASERKTALSVDSRIEAIQTAQLMECKSEVSRLRNPGFFRSLLSRESVTGAVIGYSIGSMRR